MTPGQNLASTPNSLPRKRTKSFAKRKRSDGENHDPKKKRRRIGSESENRNSKKSTAGTEVAAANVPAKPKRPRRRPKTIGIRTEIKTEIERALRTEPCPIGHLFTSTSSDGTPRATFHDVIAQLKFRHKQMRILTNAAIVSISNISSIFSIEEDEGKLYILYRPAQWSIAKCTAYVDNLPQGCTPEQLSRLVRKFGTVVKIVLPKRRITPNSRVAINGELVKDPRRFVHQPFAFVQFTDDAAVTKICEAYSHTFPATKTFPGLRTTSSFKQRWTLMATIMRRLRLLGRLRRRRRTQPLNMLRSRLKRAMHILFRKEIRLQKLKSDGERNGSKISVTSGNDIGSVVKVPNAEGQRSALSHSAKRKNSVHFKRIVNEQHQKKRKRKKHRYILDPYFIRYTVNEYFRNIQVTSYETYRLLREEYRGLVKEAKKNEKNIKNTKEAM